MEKEWLRHRGTRKVVQSESIFQRCSNIDASVGYAFCAHADPSHVAHSDRLDGGTLGNNADGDCVILRQSEVRPRIMVVDGECRTLIGLIRVAMSVRVCLSAVLIVLTACDVVQITSAILINNIVAQELEGHSMFYLSLTICNYNILPRK